MDWCCLHCEAVNSCQGQHSEFRQTFNAPSPSFFGASTARQFETKISAVQASHRACSLVRCRAAFAGSIRHRRWDAQESAPQRNVLWKDEGQ